LGELQLALTDFFQLLAPLNKCFVFSEDGVVLVILTAEVPSFLELGLLLDESLFLCADGSPLVAAFDALVEVGHALFNVTRKHVPDINLLLAAVDDLVADFSQ
jgi:hypothetical protein